MTKAIDSLNMKHALHTQRKENPRRRIPPSTQNNTGAKALLLHMLQVLTREVLCVVVRQRTGCLGELLQTSHISPLSCQVKTGVPLAVREVD